MGKILLITLFLITQVFSFMDTIIDPDIDKVVRKLKRECTLYYTDIYTSCYSKEYNRVVFTSYIVDKRSDEVNIKQRPKFYSDPKINKHLEKWYKKSSYDKGHLAWDSAFDFNQTALDLTYNLELNIVPMKNDVNRFQWSRIEKYVLKLAKDWDVLVVDIATPSILLLNRSPINIPKEIYKIVMYGENTECYKVDNIDSTKNVYPYKIDCKNLQNLIKE